MIATATSTLAIWGRVDERGTVHFLGRIEDVIKTAGANVAAAEVEATLLRHAAA